MASQSYREAAEVVWKILVDDLALMRTAVKPGIDQMVQEVALEIEIRDAELRYQRKNWAPK